ncbi:MAG: hypothetical protein GY940_04350, partial [bacterium]|nr:hypothetical protein [bacterium]
MRYFASCIICLCLFVLGGFGIPVNAEEPHPFNVHDMVTMDRVSSQVVSPDGKSIVFVIRKTDMEANKGRTDLWMINVDGTNARRLTAHPASDSSPSWSKDGRHVYFLSSRSDSSQVWRIAVDGGEAFQVTHLSRDVDNLILSPDGKKMVFSLGIPGYSGVALFDRGSEEIELLIAPGKDPKWSPDGRHIAFVRDCPLLPLPELVTAERSSQDRAYRGEEIWIMNADGTLPRRL